MILITGATGTVGKELVKLLARPEEPIRVLVHHHDKAASIAYPGANIIEGDFGLDDTLDAALNGIEKAFLLAPPGENHTELETAFVRAATRSDLRHIVKLSALGAALDSPARLLRSHAEVEQVIVDSGIPYTFLRANVFMQNFLGFRESIIHRGEFYAPLGNGHISMVDVRDLAAVAAEVLEEHGHEDKSYDVTGPESLTYADAAKRLTEALGKPVTYVDVPPEAARDSMLQAGRPPWLVDGIIELHELWKFNSAAEIADTVPYIAKKEPITFAEFAHNYAPHFGRTSRDTLAEEMDKVNLDTMTPGA